MTKKSEAAIFFTISGAALIASTGLAVVIHKSQQKKLVVVMQSRNVAWMTLKDMLEPEANDINRRLDLASRALLHENFNRIVNKNF
jgi:hypothetical protein